MTSLPKRGDRVWFITEGADEDTKPREPGCQCQWEEGDSPCPVHGEHEEPQVHPEFARGMRRAVALAKVHVRWDPESAVLGPDFSELEAAVDMELKNG